MGKDCCTRRERDGGRVNVVEKPFEDGSRRGDDEGQGKDIQCCSH